MIELLVALLILAIGSLSYIGLTLSSSRLSGDAYARGQATALAQDLLERITINNPGPTIPPVTTQRPGSTASYLVASAPYYNTAPSTYPTNCDSGSDCTYAQMAAYDLSQVAYMANQMLPAGLVAVYTLGTNQHVQVVVSWGGTTPTVGTGASDCMSSSGTTTTFNANASCVYLESVYQ